MQQAWLRVAAGLVLCLFMGACSGEESPEERSDIPYIVAPLDTVAAPVVGADSIPMQPIARAATPPHAWLPPAEQLRYTRYRNEAFDFTVAYPDTLLQPVGEIGGDRGREFASRDSQVVMIAYAVEDVSPEQLADQYQKQLDDPGSRLTYHVQHGNWYVVAGRRDDQVFYEKTIFREGVLKTVRIQYPASYQAYLEPVLATVSTSFEG